MSFLSGMKLYYRNMRGVFWRGLGAGVHNKQYDKRREPPYLLPVLHLFTFPLTVPIVAGIKTIFDIVSRKEISKEKIGNLTHAIQNITSSDEMNEKIEAILEYKAKSYSSKKILQQLVDLRDETKQKINVEYETTEQLIKSNRRDLNTQEAKKLQPKMQKYLEKNTKNPDISVSLTVGNKLTKEDEEECNIEKTKLTKLYTEERLNTQKKLFTKFLSKDKNNGKKLQDVMMKAFGL